MSKVIQRCQTSFSDTVWSNTTGIVIVERATVVVCIPDSPTHIALLAVSTEGRITISAPQKVPSTTLIIFLIELHLRNGVAFWYGKVEVWVIVRFSTFVENNFPVRCLSRTSSLHIDLAFNICNLNTSGNIGLPWLSPICLSSLSRIQEGSFFIDTCRRRVVGSCISIRYYISNCSCGETISCIVRIVFSCTSWRLSETYPSLH